MRDLVQIMTKLRVLSLTFKVLTICGAVYVFFADDGANAGYAVIPALFYFLFLRWEHSIRNRAKQ